MAYSLHNLAKSSSFERQAPFTVQVDFDHSHTTHFDSPRPSSTDLKPFDFYSQSSEALPSHSPMNSQTRVSVSLPAVKQKKPSFWRAFVPDSIPCRLYILVVVLQTFIDLAIEAVLVLKFNQAANLTPTLKESSARRLPVYFGIFGFAHVFQFILAVDAVWMRNTLQFLFLAAFNFIILIYAIVQIGEIRQELPPTTSSAHGVLVIPINVLTSVVPCVIAVAELAYLILGWSIWREFGWKVYKLLGADRRVKRMYMHFQILQCIMKFDVFFWVGFSLQLIFLVLQRTDFEYYLTVAALPASLIVLVAGHIAARYELKYLMYMFMVSCVGACAYFAFKLFRIVEQMHKQNIAPVFKSLVTFAALAMTFLVATFVWSCIVYSNFNEGLKFHMSKHKDSSSRLDGSFIGNSAEPHLNSSFPMTGKQKRMSLE